MFFKSRGSSNTARQTPADGDAALAAFASEADPGAPAPPTVSGPGSSGKTQRRVRVYGWMAIIALSGTAAAAATWQYNRRQGPPPAFLSVETTTPGAEVVVGDKPAGQTPVALWLPPGSYVLRVGSGAQQRQATIQLAAGASVVRHFDVGSPMVATTGVGEGSAQRLRIETEPAAMGVVVDGISRGKSPLTVQGLAEGSHDVQVRNGAAVMRHKIALRGGESAVLVFNSGAAAEPALAPVTAAAAGGWLSVSSAVPVQIRESGKVVGSSELDRVMLPTGSHALEFVNEALGYQSRQTVRIDAGKTTAVQLERVNGLLNINAQPWAEVWIDGERIGETPIGNLSRPIGTHEVVLRHPQLGERRERVTITARQPARLGVDLRGGKK